MPAIGLDFGSVLGIVYVLTLGVEQDTCAGRGGDMFSQNHRIV